MMALGKQFIASALTTMVYFLDRSGADLPLITVEESMLKDIVAAQVRKQGYPCNKPLSADRDREHPKQRGGWILRCENATYHIHLIPRRPANIEVQ